MALRSIGSEDTTFGYFVDGFNANQSSIDGDQSSPETLLKNWTAFAANPTKEARRKALLSALGAEVPYFRGPLSDPSAERNDFVRALLHLYSPEGEWLDNEAAVRLREDWKELLVLISYRTLVYFANRPDPFAPVSRQDWRLIASALAFFAHEIALCEQTISQTGTDLFDVYSTTRVIYEWACPLRDSDEFQGLTTAELKVLVDIAVGIGSRNPGNLSGAKTFLLSVEHLMSGKEGVVPEDRGHLVNILTYPNESFRNNSTAISIMEREELAWLVTFMVDGDN
jgi:hypothetical protein